MTREPQNREKGALRPDLATLFGLLIAVGCVVGGLLLEGGGAADLQQGTAALIVLGGTLGAVLVTTPFDVFTAATRRLAQVLFTREQRFAPTLEGILAAADRARRNGLAVLEQEALNTEDAFLRKALNLAADGTDLQEIREMMRIDMDVEEDRSEAEVRVWESAAGYAPTVGIIGAVLGLIQVMKHLENLDEVGRGIAVAFVATVYGVASANFFFLPAAGKLKARCRQQAQLRDLMLEGVLAIAEGMNPKLIRLKLSPLLPSKTTSGAARIVERSAVGKPSLETATTT